jgi:hypothetical protein
VGEDGRYGMHELLRQDAGRRLAADPAESRGAGRHAAWFSGLLPDPADPLAAGAELDADVENLRRPPTGWSPTATRPTSTAT